MSKVSFYTILDGYEPFDLLRLSKDAFYEIVAEAFPTIEVIDMRLFFIIVEDEVLIEVEVFEYKEKI
ncbi:MAG: Unknown protein [uncultured Sulfurovum sp.]|uniref:Uncharacterized protein n=1 Tax=uncultured Sulfurovum sp. TaxID=269237 RepID=A0A6S6TK21_9BACT|nr:MAG: Unknown protein [uncultured Sulfurovum sp.]